MASQGIKPKKQLGQVFLKNKRFIEKIISALKIQPKETIIEIGAGTGILTEALLKTKAKVIAIEKDSSLFNFLKERFKDNQNLEIIHEDIRNIFNSKLKIQDSEFNYKLVGNIPYYLTNYLFRLLVDLEKKPKLVVLMIQKEVALRITSKPPKMNLLAVLIQTFFQPKIICYVSKNNFWPQPKIDSAIIQLIPSKPIFQNKKEKEKFIKIIKAGFSQPRKLLIKNLNLKLKLEKEKILLVFKKTKIYKNSRAQEIGLKKWFTLFKLLK
ncbi:MAG: 16S rRNA (adenine(1518)-N(6)/adenine(1519)-N(6))-dimethyltransferase RsmA [Minisyncoccia bacterium]